MIDYDEDDYALDPDDQFCDCSDAEWDMLDCTAKCWSCGDRRNLSTAEIDNYWRAYSEFEAALWRQVRPNWRERMTLLWASIRRRLLFWRQPPARFITDDEIPF